jgi:hypothetical protein
MSVTEFAILTAQPGRGEEMQGRLPAATAELKKCEDVSSAVAYRCVERPDDFILEVVWTEVSDHLAYRETEAFGHFRAHFADLLDGVPEFAHWRRLGGGH